MNNDERTTGSGAHGQHNHGQDHQHHGHQGRTEGEEVIQLREEELVPTKQAVQAGEVELRKTVHEEQREIPVNVAHEEVTIERRPVDRPVSGEIGDMQDESVRVPVYEEQVQMQRQGRVAEEVVIGKDVVQEQGTVAGTVRREDIEVVDDIDSNLHRDVDTSR